MENHGLYFVALAQETDDLVLANLKIVLGGRRPEFHFLDVRTLLVFLGFVGLLAQLVLKLAVVHELANRWHSGGRDFHNIQSRFARRLHGVEQGHHPELIARVIDHANFASAYALVNAKTARTTSFCDKPTSEKPARRRFRHLRGTQNPLRGDRAKSIACLS